jgi:hypothetical protein
MAKVQNSIPKLSPWNERMFETEGVGSLTSKQEGDSRGRRGLLTASGRCGEVDLYTTGNNVQAAK